MPLIQIAAPQDTTKLDKRAKPEILAGLILLAEAVLQWKSVDFGRLDYAVTMRWVIPGATLTALGFQTILSSFFVSMLGMKHSP